MRKPFPSGRRARPVATLCIYSRRVAQERLEGAVLRAVKAALDDRVAEHALEVALGDLRGRIEAAEPRRLERELAQLDKKIQRKR